MPATPADIGAAMRAAVTATWSDAAIQARYPSARDGLTAPIEGMCDAVADAQALVNARGALVGVERGRFGVVVAEALLLDPAAGLPQIRLVDAELAVDAATMALRLAVDLNAETTTFEVMG